MFEPRPNPFADELKAAVLEGVRSADIEPTYSHDEVWSAVDDVLNNPETAPVD